MTWTSTLFLAQIRSLSAPCEAAGSRSAELLGVDPVGSSDPCRTARIRQPTRTELADVETTSGTGLAAAASAAAVTAAASAAAVTASAASATVTASAASATVTASAASAADNGRRRTHFSHALDTIVEFAPAAI
jgi:hypothetical protein